MMYLCGVSPTERKKDREKCDTEIPTLAGFAVGIYRIHRSIQSHIAILYRQVILALEYRETDIPALKSDGMPWLLPLIRLET